ncbi:site-2 protease family protein [Candidatus Woesebacteria bacterium]|nr:site-2 protease family protein [Candidatus Woesebacteria bacterium]
MLGVSIITFVILLSILILVHEFGHFFAAKKSGVWVEEFGIGYPPKIFSKKIGETEYSINLLPFGGFVRLHGENSLEEVKKKGRSFLHKSVGKRALIITAGVIMNLILGVVAFATVYTITGIPEPVATGEVKIVGVSPDSPAEEVGLVEGDLIVEVQGKEVGNTEEFIGIVNENVGKDLDLTYERNGELIDVSVIARAQHPKDQGALGVVISSSEIRYRFPPFWQRPFLGIYYGVKEAFFWATTIASGLVVMVVGLFSGVFPQVAGPAGLFAITNEAVQVGIVPVINLLGLISINLAIINILPIPAVDGGRLLFLFIEKIFGKRVVPKIESAVHTIGFLVLVFLLIIVSVREVKLIREYGLSGYVEYVTGGQLQ